MEKAPPPWIEICQNVSESGLLQIDPSILNKLVNKNSIDSVYMVELSPFARAEGGELQRVIDEEVKVSEDEAVRFLRQIVEGLLFLHSKDLAHLDVKPQNLLLTAAYPNCDVKLCDFGLSRVVAGEGVEVREILGTPDYTAPEVLSYEPLTLATDIWSVGVLAYVLLTGYSPFGSDNIQETFCNIGQGKLDFPDDIFDGISHLAIDFIQKTVNIDPRERLSAFSCLEHSWLSGKIQRPLPEVPQQVPQVAICDVEHAPADSATHNLDENDTQTEPVIESVFSDDGVDSGIETLSNDSGNLPGSTRCDLKLDIPESANATGESLQRMTTGHVTKLVEKFESAGHASRRSNVELGKENLVSPPPPAKRREVKF
ncbi:hypothetical protein QYM36_006870 [Artemia franciscana]|uniref:Protein kinase domain-containing protein n=1 Tax=Artemia franciscana TaxID=6661 RepID=A0AA88L876_ARTSF|nr:hypothetical protein QYM36_006870 [Artemia franciscana]